MSEQKESIPSGNELGVFLREMEESKKQFFWIAWNIANKNIFHDYEHIKAGVSGYAEKCTPDFLLNDRINNAFDGFFIFKPESSQGMVNIYMTDKESNKRLWVSSGSDVAQAIENLLIRMQSLRELQDPLNQEDHPDEDKIKFYPSDTRIHAMRAESYSEGYIDEEYNYEVEPEERSFYNLYYENISRFTSEVTFQITRLGQKKVTLGWLTEAAKEYGFFIDLVDVGNNHKKYQLHLRPDEGLEPTTYNEDVIDSAPSSILLAEHDISTVDDHVVLVQKALSYIQSLHRACFEGFDSGDENDGNSWEENGPLD